MHHILVVDDDHMVLALIDHVLRRAGFSVSCAGNGRAALGACRTEMPELVLTDMIMPEMDGLEFIAAARREFPGLPVIAMSGGTPGAGDRLERALEMGACATLLKPFSVEELLHAVRLATSGHALEPALHGHAPGDPHGAAQ